MARKTKTKTKTSAKTKPDRSDVMRAVKSKNTKPEIFVRQLLHRMGFRFRLHRKDLPGNPDIVFPSRQKVIFVNGCFWHGHNCKRGARVPQNNREYWIKKVSRNIERDQSNLNALGDIEWSAFTVWECELQTDNLIATTSRLNDFLCEELG